MSWPLFEAVKQAQASAGDDGALALLADNRAAVDGFAPLLVTEAEIALRRREFDAAEAALQRALAVEPGYYWAHYTLAMVRRWQRRLDEAAACLREAHAAAGWPESRARGYRFTDDYFSVNIEAWTRWFAELAGRPGLSVLEVGSWQGASAAWMLDRLLTDPTARLTCIDTFEGSSEHAGIMGAIPDIETLFDDNIAKTGAAARVRKLKGRSQDVLRGVSQTFDLIYLDGAHEAKFVIQDAVLSWPLLKPGGLLLFDDYPFSVPGEPEQDTARAIDFFLSVFGRELTVLEHGRQVLVRRTA